MKAFVGVILACMATFPAHADYMRVGEPAPDGLQVGVRLTEQKLPASACFGSKARKAIMQAIKDGRRVSLPVSGCWKIDGEFVYVAIADPEKTAPVTFRYRVSEFVDVEPQ